MVTNASYHDKLEKRNRELKILNKIAASLNGEIELQEALQTALESIVEMFCLKTGWIFLYNEQGKDFYVASSLNLPPALEEHPRRLSGTCYCLDTYLDGDMSGAANINAITCTRLKDLKEGTEGLLYHASIPLYTQKHEPLGILNVSSTDWSEIADEDLRLLKTVADLLSIAIERTRLFQQSKDIGAMNERYRLAREMHDTIAQDLAATALQLETADALFDAGADPEKVQQIVRRALEMTRSSLKEVRRSVMDLRATPLQGRTLPEALRSLLDDESLSTSIETRIEVMGSVPPLPARVSMALYRIAQEAVNNVKKHANANCISLELNALPNEVEMIIEDNGQGFEDREIPDGHYGLVGINERVKLLGGWMCVCSTPKVGTSVTVRIPIEAKDDKENSNYRSR